ncbi:UDP-N-acetylmuramoyl-tripeptide--D-alanyl-D-alanine ligase [Paracoccus pacificus]|uniref:UDP-N-acetylmuramoyl-tripeptide--D-alanyl-D-alanine ligase n=1 Tax=Paracoccus pacificus TaxID=1463598 RepID=A0ABW4R8T0_9RHOB
MALWTATEIARATGGRLQGDWSVTGVSIDTRTIAPGDLFVALKDVRDGHDFVAIALEKGAGAAMVSRVPEGVGPDAPLIIVDDVLAGLGALGVAGRARTAARVIAITGSVGKTSTKDMARLALAGQGRVHAAEASYNNHWGVPLTLARMPADTEFAVLELGMNHPGEIAPLARMARPHAALITTIAAVHLEAFGRMEGIAAEKAAIFTGLEPEGAAIVPTGLDVTPVLEQGAAGHRLLRFGRQAQDDVRLITATPESDTTLVEAELNGRPLAFRIGSAGEHFALNALGVIAAVHAIGADPVTAAEALSQWSPPAGRGAREKIGAVEIIDDAFNASPTSLAAGLALLSRLEPAPGGRRVLILGDMLELGPDEQALHAGMARHPAMQGVALVHTAGPLMRHLYDALPPAQRGIWAETAADLVAQAGNLVRRGDIVLIKGSKGSRISTVVDALRKLGDGLGSERRE